MKIKFVRILSFSCCFFISSYYSFSKLTSNIRSESNSTTYNLLKKPDKSKIKNYNDSCIEKGIWTGSVITYGTLDKGIIYHEAFGYTSECKDAKVKNDAIFDLASITKPIATATAVAILLDKHKISPDLLFTEILNEYKGKLINKISIRDLARHVSGFDNYKPYIETNKVTNHVLEVSPVRKSGTYEYACINYILLGMIVEKISDTRLDEFCNVNIFNPLEMKDTQFGPVKNYNKDRMIKPIFTPYLGIVSDEPARVAGRPIGNAGLFSTTTDLSKYCMMILQNGKYDNKTILTSSARDILTSNPGPISESTYTFGWRTNRTETPSRLSEKTLMHSGFTGQSIWIDLEKKVFVIILTNRTGDHSESSLARLKLAELLLSIFYHNGS